MLKSEILEEILEIRALIFDLDGVVADTEECHYRAWKQLADENGWPFDRTRNELLLGLPRAASLAIILDGRAINDEQLGELLESKNRYFFNQLTADPRAVRALPGVAELLRSAHENGIKTALCSSSQNGHAMLAHLGLATLFDAIVDGNDVTRHKPAPDPYLKAARRLGVLPKFCVALEDASVGIASARAAGMATVGVGRAENVKAADLILGSLENVQWRDLQNALKDF